MKTSLLENKTGGLATWKPLLAWSFFGLLFTTSSNAQPPPDQFGDEHQGGCVIRRNDGQVKDADQYARPDIIGTFESSPFGIYLRKYSQVSLTYSKIANDSLSTAKAYRVDMTVLNAKKKTPVLSVPAVGTANYYLGSVTAEQVPAYYRAKYKSVRDSLDLHIYGASNGPRLALVLRPGGNANHLKLQFTGQDSLGINWQGGLIMFLQDYWLELKQALAYQVLGDGTIVPISWTPTYTHQDSSAIIGFNVGTYDSTKTLVLEIGYGPVAQGGMDTRNLEWSTFMGSGQGDTFSAVETDTEGNPYVCGNSWSDDFPVAPGTQEYDPSVPNPPGSDNAILAKFNGDTKRLVWATFYGGTTGNGTHPGSYAACTNAQRIALFNGTDNARQYVYAVGSTNCPDFPLKAVSSSVYNNSNPQSFQGGIRRMWTGAFKKTNGVCEWSTTHGQQSGTTWAEDGLSVAVDEGTDQVAVGGRLDYDLPNYPVFPLVTPSGAFSKSNGGAFLVVYNADGTIRWSTTFAGRDDYVPYNQINDLEFTSVSYDNARKLWIAGSTSYDGASPLTGVPSPVIGGFYQDPSTQDAIIASIDLTTLQLDYLTAWGGPDLTYSSSINVAMGLDVAGKDLWVVGGTHATGLTNVECPDPAVTGVYHTHTHSGGSWNNRCEGFILSMNPATFTLNYGTLIGGPNDDMLLDVNHDPDQATVYISGESRSNTGIVTDLDPQLYFQPLNSNLNTRDAIILALDNVRAAPVMRWRTAFGGTQSDRGWGIAASLTDVYFVGATASDWWQGFPLMEYDVNDDFDFFQEGSYGGPNVWSFLPWYAFEAMLDFEWNYYGEVVTENTSQNSEAFIASFASNFYVGTLEIVKAPELVVVPLQGIAQWGVRYPFPGKWTLTAYDATGRQISTWTTQSGGQAIDLSAQATGIYLLRATEFGGTYLSGKVLRP